MHKKIIFGFLFLATPTWAQEANMAREMSQQLGRYQGTIAKLEKQMEQLMGDVRALQRDQERVNKFADTQNNKIQGTIDEIQQFKNTEIENMRQSFWGSGQRDCKELGVKHQQIKVSLKPDNTESVRFLCYDGKGLLLGAERFVVGN